MTFVRHCGEARKHKTHLYFKTWFQEQLRKLGFREVGMTDMWTVTYRCQGTPK